MNIRVKKVNKEKDLLDVIKAGFIAVWDSEKPLYFALERVYEDISDAKKLHIKVCKNVSYTKPISLYDSNKQINKFGNIFEFLDFYYKSVDNLKNPYIVINSNSQSELFNTIQQLIYLKINIDIYTAEELKKKKVVEKFKSTYKDFKKSISQIKEDLNKKWYKNQGVEDLKAEIIEHLEKIENELGKVESDIKVAVFSTKKSGKSMVVNSLIGEEIAPTSIELPTPNNILYIPYGEDKIKLKYKGEEKIFSNHLDCKEYIRKEFKSVKERGEKLENMEIYYPYRKYKNKKYRIYDTPGPDLASKDEIKSHREVYKEALLNSDVAIFIIDYTKYAQKSEVELLEEIKKEFFDKSTRNMSLICAVNKIDQVFGDADTEKMVVRIADFMMHKFRELGFDNFIVIPISARTYFYLEKIAEKFPDVKDSDNLRKRLYEDDIDKFKDGVIEQYIAEIQNLANNFRKSFGIENLKYNDLINFSYFDYFEKYVDYIAQSKAEVERIYGSVITNIGLILTSLSNDINGRIKLLQTDINKIKDELQKFLQNVKPTLDKEKKNAEKSLQEAKDNIYRELKQVIKDNLKNIHQNRKAKLEENLKKLRENISQDVSNLENGNISKEEFFEKYKRLNIDLSIDTRIEGLYLFERNIKDRLKEPQKNIDKTTNILKYSIDELNRSLQEIIGRDVVSSSSIFLTPDFNISINSEHIISEMKKILDRFTFEYQPMTDIFDKKAETQSFMEKLRSTIKDFLSELTGTKWKEIELMLENQLLKVKNELLEKFEREYLLINEKADELLESYKNWLDTEFSSIEFSIELYFDDVEEVISGISEDLSKNIDTREKILEFSKYVSGLTKNIYKQWEDIKNVN